MLSIWSRLSDPSNQNWYKFTNVSQIISEFEIKGVSGLKMTNLKKCYNYIYWNLDNTYITFQESYQKYSGLIVNYVAYSSSDSKNSRSAYIVVFWSNSNGNIASFKEMEISARPGVIGFFLKHTTEVNGNCFQHWFAFCDWFYPFNTSIRSKFGKPLAVWYRKLFEQSGAASFILVQRIFRK